MSQKEEKVQKIDELSQNEKFRKELEDLVSPPEFKEADALYKESVYKVLRCLEEVVPDLKKSIPILKKYGYGECLFAVKAIKAQVKIFENQLNSHE